jgi:hypothetical protein
VGGLGPGEDRGMLGRTQARVHLILVNNGMLTYYAHPPWRTLVEFKRAGFLILDSPFPVGRFRSVLSSRAWRVPHGRNIRTLHESRE